MLCKFNSMAVDNILTQKQEVIPFKSLNSNSEAENLSSVCTKLWLGPKTIIDQGGLGKVQPTCAVPCQTIWSMADLPAVPPPLDLVLDQPGEEEEGQHVGGHEHVEHVVPVVVPGEGAGHEGPDGGT